MSKKKEALNEKIDNAVTLAVDDDNGGQEEREIGGTAKKELVVADGQCILCISGMKYPGDKITEKNVNGGQAALDRLKEMGKVV